MTKSKEIELTEDAKKDNVDKSWNNWEDMNLDTPATWSHSLMLGGTKFCLVTNLSNKEMALTEAEKFSDRKILISKGRYTGTDISDKGLIGLWVAIS